MNILIAIMMFFTSVFLGCKKDYDSTNNHIKNEFSNQKTIDSLQLDLNKDGHKDKIVVVQNNKDEREISVLLSTKGGFKEIARNNVIIGCATCGNQSGDPYIGLRASSSGFDISLEDGIYSFSYIEGNIILIKIDYLDLKETADGVEEKHEIFNSKDFGLVNLKNFTNDIVTSLVYNLNGKDSENITSTKMRRSVYQFPQKKYQF